RTILKQALDSTDADTGASRQNEPDMHAAAQLAPLRVVDDQTGCPTYAGDLAEAIITLASRQNAGQNPNTSSVDTKTPHANEPDTNRSYHYCGANAMTWYAFAQQILACAKALNESLIMPELHAIKTLEYAAPAARPAMSVLSCKKIEA